ncbi:hypothetical protein BH09BAC5_BH09BAC5_06680 [soil metagenome]
MSDIKHFSLFKILFGLIVFAVSESNGNAQGCSDAGLCSFGSLNLMRTRYVIIQPDEVKLTAVDVKDSTPLFLGDYNKDYYTIRQVVMDSGAFSRLMNVEFTSYYGKAMEGNASVFINQLEGNFRITERRLFGQIKIPYSIISGNLGTTNGLSDVTMSLSYVAIENRKINLSFAGGVKIPANNANLSLNNRPLPMVYQTSLGSTDLLLGSRFSYKKWDFTVGYQHSLNANENRYQHISGISDSTIYNGYFESNGLRRYDDGLFRINRKYNISKVSINTGLLFIYHLQDDDITNPLGERVKATGSKGLTLNLNLAGSIPINKNTELTIILAKPVIQRKNVPDGLARSFVGIIGLKRNF